MKDIIKEYIELFKNYKFFITIWLIALCSVIAINITTKKSHNFLGITESKEIHLSSKSPSKIKKINIIPGQKVKKGQLLIELEQPDLSIKITEVTHRLRELKAQYKFNVKLNSKLKLNAHRESHHNSNVEDDLLTIQIQGLEKKLQLLLTEKDHFYIFSSIDGIVGSINYRPGENVSPFSTIATLHKATPSYVRGYIHENIHNKAKEGIVVEINSLTSNPKKINGHIVSIGSRIIELPERFKKHPEVKVWGREVIITIPKVNHYLMGERVYVNIKENLQESEISNFIVSNANATQIITSKKTLNPALAKDIIVPSTLSDFNIVEPSGIQYIPELNKYLLISDENPQERPFIYLLNEDGMIDNRVLEVSDLKKIDDMESITEDEYSNLYILSSQSHKKKKKTIQESRKQLVKIKRDELLLKADKTVQLYDLLLEKAIAEKDSKWSKLILKKRKRGNKKKYQLKINIEGMFVKENKLYLGLRSPIKKSSVYILVIDKLSELFKQNSLEHNNVSIWKKITLPHKNEGISDMSIINNKLYFTTVSNKGRLQGSLYVLESLSSKSPKLITKFKKLKPEGITKTSVKNQILVTFDQGEMRKAKFVIIKL